jgi:hypothetical protein
MIVAAPLTCDNADHRFCPDAETRTTEDLMRTTRPAGAALIAAGLLVAVAGCGGGSTAPAAAPPAATDPATATASVCGSLLQLDGVPAPEGGPDGPPPAAAVKEWGAAAAPVLDAAMAKAPAALTPSLTALQPVFRAAATQGSEPNYEDPGFTGAITAYERWAHENCGYRKVALTGTDFRFSGAPSTLAAGPVSILLTNKSADGQFHVAHLAKAKDSAMTVDQFVATPFENLMQVVDLVPGVAMAAPGQTGGFLADLEPGKYFLVCPVGDEGQLPHHVQGMINEVTVA